MSNTNTLTMDQPIPTSLLDTAAQGLVGLGIDRVEGPLKVAGAPPMRRSMRSTIWLMVYSSAVRSRAARLSLSMRTRCWVCRA